MTLNAYPVQFPDQMRQHLRALRKSRGLTQAQLGVLLGVSQARVAEIEANPAVISVEQLMKILSTLGVRLILQEDLANLPSYDGIRQASKTARNARALETPPISTGTPLEIAGEPGSHNDAAPISSSPTKTAPKKLLIIPARKGSW